MRRPHPDRVKWEMLWATMGDVNLVARLLVLLAGAGLVLIAATDAVSTLVTTQRRSSRLWPTYIFYRRSWWLWRALARRIGAEHGRERLLAVYGPLSLLGLLVIWVLLLLVGWGLVWWVLRDRLSGWTATWTRCISPASASSPSASATSCPSAAWPGCWPWPRRSWGWSPSPW